MLSVSSQLVPSSSKSTFVDAEGNSIRIFVEASIVGRPKIIRTLRNAGAKIVLAPDECQILIVDDTCDGVQGVVDTWGTAKGPVVLESAWVKQSMDREHAYLEQENWGGHRLYSRGPPMQDEDDEFDEGVPPNPTRNQKPSLPTPRQTPVNAHPTPANGSTQNGMPHPQPNQIASPAPHPTPQNGETVNGLALSSQAMTFPPTAYVNMAIPAYLAETVLDMMRWQPSYMQNPGTYGFFGGTHPSGLPSQPTQQLTQHNHNFFPSLPAPPGSSTVAPSWRAQDSPSTHLHSSHSRSQSPRASGHSTSPPLKRRRSGWETSASDRFAGKHLEDLSQPLAKFPINDRGSDALSPLRRSPTTPSYAGDSQAEEPIDGAMLFQSTNGSPLHFFVHIECKNRKQLVTTIKKHGGVITANISTADYAILNQYADNFPELLGNAINDKTPALLPKFIQSCVDEGVLLEPDAFVFEGMVMQKKRGRPAIHAIKNPPLRKVTVKPSPKKALVVSKPVSRAKTPPSAHTDLVFAAYPHLREEIRKQLQSPPQTVVTYASGKNKFTQEEAEYAWKTVGILLKADPDMTVSNMALFNHVDMPQHSHGSWSMFFTKPNNRNELEKLRKMAGVALRKVQRNEVQVQREAAQTAPVEQTSRYEEEQRNDIAEPSVDVPPSPLPTVQTIDPPVEEATEDADGDIVAFLSSGGADDRTDDEVWQILSNMHPYKSSEEWKSHWDVHGGRLNEIINSMLPKAEPE